MREEWQTGVIRSASGTRAVAFFVFTLVWNAFSWAMAALVVPEAAHRGEWGALATLIFPAVGIMIAFPAVSGVVRWLRFRRVTLRMQAPGVIGGPLRGVIETGVSLPPEVRVTVMVQCVHRTVTGSGKNRSTREEVLWQDESIVRPAHAVGGAAGSTIPVEFAIPFGLPESSREPSDSFHLWRLNASTEIAGPDFDSQFEIPVFVTAESSRTSTVEAARTRATPAVAAGSREGIAVSINAEGEHELVIRPPWTLGQNLGCLIPGLLLLIGSVIGVSRGLPFIVPAVLGVLFTAIVLMVVDGVFCPRRVLIRRGFLEIRGVCLGMITRRIALAGITGVSISSGVQVGMSAGCSRWQVELARGTGRRSVTLSSSLRRKADAELLAAEIRRHLPGAGGQPRPGTDRAPV